MRRLVLLAAVLAALGAGCSPPVDVAKSLEVLEVSTGWFDVGVVNGQNKLVPAISFKLKNVSEDPLIVVQTNVIFQRVSDPEEWGSGFLRVTGSEGLAPGATTDMLTVRSPLGYTGTEARAEMLKNSNFVDAKVRILVKAGSAQWTPLNEYPIERRLVAP